MSSTFTINNEKGQTKLTDFFTEKPVKFQPKFKQPWLPKEEYIKSLKSKSQIKKSIMKTPRKSSKKTNQKYSSEKNKNYVVEDLFHPYCQMLTEQFNEQISIERTKLVKVIASAPAACPEFEELDINWDNYCPTCYDPKIKGYVYCVTCQSLY